MAEFDEAVERGAVGLERKSRIMHADEKQRVAYHEAGHALVACSLPNTHPVHKVSIIPRGVGALGYVLSRPDEDRYLMTQSELESQIKVALGGTLAEEIGLPRDLQRRHQRPGAGQPDRPQHGQGIRHEPAGPRQLPRAGTAPPFLDGAGGDGERDYSEQTAREIDLEVRKIIDDATERGARRSCWRGARALEAVAQRLIEKEVIDGAELRQLLEKHNPGPQLVPGSLAVVVEVEGHPAPVSALEAVVLSERRGEGAEGAVGS